MCVFLYDTDRQSTDTHANRHSHMIQWPYCTPRWPKGTGHISSGENRCSLRCAYRKQWRQHSTCAQVHNSTQHSTAERSCAGCAAPRLPRRVSLRRRVARYGPATDRRTIWARVVAYTHPTARQPPLVKHPARTHLKHNNNNSSSNNNNNVIQS